MKVSEKGEGGMKEGEGIEKGKASEEKEGEAGTVEKKKGSIVEWFYRCIVKEG